MSDPINGVSNPAGNIPTGNKPKPSQESAATQGLFDGVNFLLVNSRRIGQLLLQYL